MMPHEEINDLEPVKIRRTNDNSRQRPNEQNRHNPFNNNAQDNVAYAAHIGGFIAGLILINLFNKNNFSKEKKLTKGSMPNSN